MSAQQSLREGPRFAVGQQPFHKAQHVVRVQLVHRQPPEVTQHITDTVSFLAASDDPRVKVMIA